MQKGILLFDADTDGSHISAVRQGVRNYAMSPDSLVQYIDLNSGGITWVRSKWPARACGVVGWYRSEAKAEVLRIQGIPCINLCESKRRHPSPSVRFSEEGARAAAYFIGELGYRHLAFVGSTKVAGTVRCYGEFVTEAKARGVDVWEALDIIEQPGCLWNGINTAIITRVEGLVCNAPKPVGVFCPERGHGLLVCEVAKAVGCPVPQDVGILGIGEKRSDAASRTELSVIEVDHCKQGFEAAKMIAANLVKGCKLTDMRLAPDGFRPGATTINSSQMSRCVVRGREIYVADPSVKPVELAKRLRLGRRTLDRHFKSCHGKAARPVLVDVRCDRAAEFMSANPHCDLEIIAGLSGFESRQQLRRAFKRRHKITPSEFRKQCRKRNGSWARSIRREDSLVRRMMEAARREI